MSVVHFQLCSIIIHFLQEILQGWMETERTGSEIGKHDIILIASILFVFENFSKVLSKRKSRVIATWQHHAIEQL